MKGRLRVLMLEPNKPAYMMTLDSEILDTLLFTYNGFDLSFEDMCFEEPLEGLGNGNFISLCYTSNGKLEDASILPPNRRIQTLEKEIVIFGPAYLGVFNYSTGNYLDMSGKLIAKYEKLMNDFMLGEH